MPALDSDFAGRFITITCDDEIYAFIPTGTTTFDDLIANMDNIRESVSAVLDEVAKLPDDERMSLVDVMDCIRDTVEENFIDDTGKPLSMNCWGIGVKAVDIVFE